MKRDAFQAIADPTRRAILMSLKEKEQNVNAIAEQFDMTRQAVSLHVKYLEECGVISVYQTGRQRICKLDVKELNTVNEWMEPFKELLEGQFRKMDKVLAKLKKK
ncbi:MAG: winged helix-turn-helix transcriptional regulator [Bacteroidota bacterium]|nr:winged helix-turn-helix transcriptional regulator [Bacteroidota bacterium]